MRFRRYLTFEVLVRIAADMVLVNIGYLTALLLRVIWRAATDPEVSAQAELAQAAQTYATTFWLLTLIAVVIYGASGFYSRGRFYQGRFKAAVVFQAVSITYLLFGSITYLVWARGWLADTPGTAFVVAWFLTLVMTEGARLWSVLWRSVINRESPTPRERAGEGDIHHVLVIGGAGYIGSMLCRQLLEQGYSVRVLDALLYGRDSVAGLLDEPRFELMEGDSRDIGAIFRAMLGMDAVVHLGELVGDPACALDERLTLEINLAATRMVAEAARGCGIERFVYASSCSVYGTGSEILDERSTLSPVSLYARAKIGSENALLALDGPEFHPVILRLATVYGLSPRPRFDLVVNLLTAKAVSDGKITIFGGDQWRPFVHVADVARAIICCLEAPLISVKGQIFNVGSDAQNYTIAQVGELVQHSIPEASLVFHEKEVDKRDYHVSFAKIRRELGFKPSFSIERGVREIQLALKAGRIGDYHDKHYSNYLTLSDPDNELSIWARHINELYAPSLADEPVQSAVPAAVSGT